MLAWWSHVRVNGGLYAAIDKWFAAKSACLAICECLLKKVNRRANIGEACEDIRTTIKAWEIWKC